MKTRKMKTNQSPTSHRPGFGGKEWEPAPWNEEGRFFPTNCKAGGVAVRKRKQIQGNKTGVYTLLHGQHEKLQVREVKDHENITHHQDHDFL